jgi:hypothetical protein
MAVAGLYRETSMAPTVSFTTRDSYLNKITYVITGLKRLFDGSLQRSIQEVLRILPFFSQK